MGTEVLLDFCIMAACFVVAKIIRTQCQLLQRLYIPTAVIAGFIAFFLQHFYGAFGNGMASYPGILIAVLFCTMALGRESKRIGKSDFKRIYQTFFVNTAAEISQFGFFMVIGVVLLPLVFQEINSAFGLMLPSGFMGGHGTAAAIGSELVKFGWNEALSIGFTFATIGLLGGIGLGIILINYGVRKGYVKNINKDFAKDLNNGIIPVGKRGALAEETIHPSSMDSLTWALCLILVCVGAAYGANYVISDLWNVSVPTYGLALLFGFALSQTLNFLKSNSVVDRKLVTHMGSCSADWLIAFGIASVKVSVVMDNLVPIVWLSLAGFVFALLWFASGRVLFSDYWFERSIFIFGMSTGVFSTGVLLLRIVDPRFETGVLIDFGLAWIVLSIIDLLCVTFSPVFVTHGMGIAFGSVLCLLAVCCVLAIILQKKIMRT